MRAPANIIPLPPYSLEAEQSVLGSILVKPEMLPKVAAIIGPGDFYREAHAKIFKTFLDLQAGGIPVDLSTVVITLKERGQLEGVGGPVFLASLNEQVGFAINVEFPARTVAKKSYLRWARELSLEILKACDNGGHGLEDLISKIAQPFRQVKGGISPISAHDLGIKTFAPPRWAIPDLLPEGLIILAGKPKIGKSWLALNLAVAIASGGLALGKIQVQPGEVLYLGLEDSERRLQERLQKIIPCGALPGALHFLTAKDFPPLHKGGLQGLDTWLTDHPQARLVVIDTLGRVKPPRGRNQDSYDADTAIISTLQTLSIKHRIALILIHHTRKLATDDFVESISGTHAISGAADCLAVLLRKDRAAADAILQITGRDVPDLEVALKFHGDLGAWELMGEGREFAMSQERNDLLLILKEIGPKTPAQLAKILGKKRENIKYLLSKLRDSGEVKAINGEYSVYK